MSYRDLPLKARLAFKQRLAYEQGGTKLPMPWGTITVAPCIYCQWWFPIWRLTYEHLLNRRDGGTNRKANLRLACNACNGRRNDREMGASRPFVLSSWKPPRLNRWRRKRLAKGRCLSRPCHAPLLCPRCHRCEAHVGRQRACPAVLKLLAPLPFPLICHVEQEGGRHDQPAHEGQRAAGAQAGRKVQRVAQMVLEASGSQNGAARGASVGPQDDGYWCSAPLVSFEVICAAALRNGW